MLPLKNKIPSIIPTDNTEEGRVTKYFYDSQSRLSIVLYPWTKEKTESDRKEAEEAGLYFTPEKGNGERYTLSAQETAQLRQLLNTASPARGNAVNSTQMVWRESYSYDKNGNRMTKTTPWGTLRYEYDRENRLTKRGDVVYVNDRDGNTLSEKGIRYEAKYEYNGQNRMVYSEAVSRAEKTHTVTMYSYDALGRRTLTESVTGQITRTLYDGGSFEVIREGEAFRNGSLTTQFSSARNNTGTLGSNQATGERYRWISEDGVSRTEDGYDMQGGRYAARGVTLYGNGEAVAVSYSSSTASRTVYLGKDVMGSVRTATTDNAAIEDRYEYDAFGTPYCGDLGGMMNLGYTGKPYDTATGLYNYGFRDYRPQAARFTTLDPIRDGNNWFAYVNNDPVNWVDRWGLEPTLAARNLSYVQYLVMVAPMYQHGGGGRYPITGTPIGGDYYYCNQATFDIATATGFNIDALFGPNSLNKNDRDNTNANQATQNLVEAAKQGIVIKIPGGVAQYYADQGYTVIAAWENPNSKVSGHLATVSPNYFPSGYTNVMYPISYDPYIAQVGASPHGITNASDAFKNNTPGYYIDPNQNLNTFDISGVAQRKEKPKKGK